MGKKIEQAEDGKEPKDFLLKNGNTKSRSHTCDST